MSKDNEIEIYEDKLPSDKKELQKEVLKYRKKEKKEKENRKQRIQIVLLLILIGIMGIAIMMQLGSEQLIDNQNNGSIDEIPLEQYQNTSNGFYTEQYKSASERYGTNPIQINKRTTQNGITTNIKQIAFLQDKTIIAVEVINHNDQSVHLMLPQQSYLKDGYGRRYEIDPFESEGNLNSTLPGLSKDYTNLVFEKIDKEANSLTYSVNIGGLMGTPAWEQSVSFEI